METKLWFIERLVSHRESFTIEASSAKEAEKFAYSLDCWNEDGFISHETVSHVDVEPILPVKMEA
jgi:hypothetical protein